MTRPTEQERPRCGWSGTDPLYIAYHDEEWGIPAHDDRHLFEMLVLEGAQAGLSWLTILRKRAAYRRAFRTWWPGCRMRTWKGSSWMKASSATV